MTAQADRVMTGKIARVIRCLRLLESGWWSATGLAAEIDVCTRSVNRYLDDLQEAGVLIQTSGPVGLPGPGKPVLFYHVPR